MSNASLATASKKLLIAAASIQAAIQAATVAVLVQYDTRDEAEQRRDEAHALLDALINSLEILSAGSPPVLIYDQLRELRALISASIEQQLLSLPAVSKAVITHPQPALTISIELYQDATRTKELVTRNNVIHPLFVSGDLEYIS